MVVVVPILAQEREYQEGVVPRLAWRRHRVLKRQVPIHVHRVNHEQHALECNSTRQPKVPIRDDPRLDDRLKERVEEGALRSDDLTQRAPHV